jgi:ribosome-binding factor A
LATKKNRGPGARPVQVGEQIRQCVGELLQEGGLKDPRISPPGALVTVTEVRMTQDLRLGRVLISVFPDHDEALLTSVFQGFASARNELRLQVARRLRLRFTPDFAFLVDDSMAYGARIEAVLREINAEAERAAGEGAPSADEA